MLIIAIIISFTISNFNGFYFAFRIIDRYSLYLY